MGSNDYGNVRLELEDHTPSGPVRTVLERTNAYGPSAQESLRETREHHDERVRAALRREEDVNK